MKLRGNALEVRRHLVRIRWVHQRRAEVLGAGITAGLDRDHRGVDRVRRVPELSLHPIDKRPERALTTFVRHADAAGIDEMPSVDVAFELHVRMPADDERLLDAGERGPKALVGRDTRQDLVVVPRRAVAPRRRRTCGRSERAGIARERNRLRVGISRSQARAQALDRCARVSLTSHLRLTAR